MPNQRKIKKTKNSDELQEDINLILKKGVKYYEKGEYKNAINCFSEVIEHDNENMYAYFNRGCSYLELEIDKIDMATDDLEKNIEIFEKNIDDYNNNNTYYNNFVSFHYNLGKCYYSKHSFDKAINEFSKVIDLDLKDKKITQVKKTIFLSYYLISKCYFLKEGIYKAHYIDKAIEKSKEIENIEQYLFDLHLTRGIFNSINKKYTEALKDFDEARNLMPDMESWVAFYKILIFLEQKEYKKTIKESSKLLENNPRDMYLYLFNALSLLEIGEEIKAKKVIEKALGYKPSLIIKKDADFINDPSNVLNQLFFPFLCIFVKKFDLALKYVNNFIKYYPDISILYFLNSLIYLFKNGEKRSIKNLKIFYQKKNRKVKVNIDNYSSPFIEGLNKGTEYFSKVFDKMLLEKITNLSSSYSISVNYLTEFIFTNFCLDNEISDKRKFINAAKYFDSLYENFSIVEEVKQVETEFIKRIFTNYPVDKLSILDTLKKDGKERFRTIIKLCFLLELLKKELENKKSSYSQPLFDIYFNLNKELLRNLRHTIEIKEEKNAQIKIEWERKVAQAKLDERNKTIADLSHSIKNMISSVIDPLENLKNEKEVKPIIIDNALRGSNLIREIVNAMNLSFKGSFDDFIYDAKHNSEKESLNINSMFIESLKHSVINMFDGKYFSNFMHKYFPVKDSYLKAKEDWDKISQSQDKQKIEKFLKNHFFDINFDFDKSIKYTIGNEKGSAIKLMILLQEIIFNAVKYSSFVKKDERFLKINFSTSKEEITIKVENRYKPKVKTKTTGLGHVIIENFAKLLNTKPVIKKSNDIYSISIAFKNFWGK